MSSQETLLRYRKTKKGILTNIYDKQIDRSILRGFPKPQYSLKWLHDRFLPDQKFERLYREWIASGFDKWKKPSIDRIDRKLPYTERNIHLMTWQENRFKETMERRCRKGKVLQIKNDKVIMEYQSQREAVKLTGFSQSNISEVLNGKRKSANGFNWKYKSEFGNKYET